MRKLTLGLIIALSISILVIVNCIVKLSAYRGDILKLQDQLNAEWLGENTAKKTLFPKDEKIEGYSYKDDNREVMALKDKIDQLTKENEVLKNRLKENASSTKDNTAIGKRALWSNTTGYKNTAVGSWSLPKNTTGQFNTAIGYNALNDNVTGSNNTATGYQALSKNTASNNSAFGYQALFSNTSGSRNVAVGYSALLSNTNGTANIAIGYEALNAVTTSGENTAVGDRTLRSNTGGMNTAIGCIALFSNSTGESNTGVGYRAMQDVTTGGSNTAVGNWSLTNILGGSDNTALGKRAYQNGSYNNSMALGSSSVITASNQVRVGNASITSIGGQVGWTTLSDARLKKDVTENVPGLAFITKLRPVTYHHNLDEIAKSTNMIDSLRNPEYEFLAKDMIRTGFIAQEVEKAANELGFDFSGVDKPKNEND